MKNKIVAISAILIALLAAVPLVGAQGPGTSYSFTLMGPNVSMIDCPPSPPTFCPTVPGTDADEGDWLILTGSGTFDTSTNAASGGGAFTHMNWEGTVHGRGIWTVTKFVSFTSYGGPNPGYQGGLLRVTIHAVNTAGEQFNFMVQISSLVGEPPSDAPDEGATIWTLNGAYPIFGVVLSGDTLFHLNG